MPNRIIEDLKKVDETSYPYIFEQDASVALKNGVLIRTNIYYPKGIKHGQKYPAVITYGPYGKDVPYERYICHHAHPLCLSNVSLCADYRGFNQFPAEKLRGTAR